MTISASVTASRLEAAGVAPVSRATSSACLALEALIVTLWPARTPDLASALPTLPAPMIAICISLSSASAGGLNDENNVRQGIYSTIGPFGHADADGIEFEPVAELVAGPGAQPEGPQRRQGQVGGARLGSPWRVPVHLLARRRRRAPLGTPAVRAFREPGRVHRLAWGARGVAGSPVLCCGRFEVDAGAGDVQLLADGAPARRHRDRPYLVRSCHAAHATGDRGDLSPRQARLRRPGLPPARMEVRLAQRGVAAGRQAIRLHLRGHLPPAHDRQGAQPGYRLVFDDRRRVAAQESSIRRVA